MYDVKDDKVQDVRAGLDLILVEDGSDAAQCREEVSHEESRKVEQGSKEEAEGHGSSLPLTLRGRTSTPKSQKPKADDRCWTSQHTPRFDFAERFPNAEERRLPSKTISSTS